MTTFRPAVRDIASWIRAKLVPSVRPRTVARDHDARVTWYRDVVRPRILSTPPVKGTTDPVCEIHVLTSARDCLNAMWSLKSFYAVSRRRYSLCIHDDGSLGTEEFLLLRKHFPDARVIARVEADWTTEGRLSRFPRSRLFRAVNPFGIRLVDFHEYLRADRLVVLDSDVLFFDTPVEFLRRVEDPAYRLNTFNADVMASGYTTTFAEQEPASTFPHFDAAAVRAQVGFDLQPRLNAGFGLVHRGSIPLEWIEEFLALPGIDLAIRNGRAGDRRSAIQFFLIEQTLVALCSSRFGVELLPKDYDVVLTPGLGARSVRHYIGTIRDLMYTEGLARLVRRGFLDGNWPPAS
ncbi:MAG: hypothetical protein AB7Q29_05525 [Vicinamibacterales bacterium]